MRIKSLFYILLLLLVTGCSTNKIIYFENGNPSKIEQATKGLKLNEFLPPSKNLEGTIAIRSIETEVNHKLDSNILYLIEDILIASLIENQYKVVERDPNVLSNLYRESSDKFKIEKSNYKESDLKEKYIETNLNAADYILSYRVIECGVTYNNIKNEIGNMNYSKVERLAITRLHCRLTNAKTSEIIAAGLLDNEIIDIINVEDIESLKEISYNYYNYTLPISSNEQLKIESNQSSDEKNNVENKEENDSTKKEKKKSKRGWWLAILFPLFNLMADG